MDKSECLMVVSSIGAVWHMRRHKLWCMQVLVTVVGLTRLIGTAGVRCAFRSDGGDVLKVTNAN